MWGNVSSVQDVMSAYHSTLELGDERVADMLLMQSPVPVTVICLSYTYFVLLLGPRLMMDRKPFGLKRLIAVYNVFQIIFNAVLFAKCLEFWIKYYGWGFSCLPVVPDNITYDDKIMAARLCHLYFINKIIDLLDTIFFVLKKKNNKISVLHVFHHAIMPFSCWCGVKFHPGGNLAFFALPNLFVHVWMYLYYLVANFGPKYQKYIWWKKHLTEMQLIQFAMVGLYTFYVTHICNLNKIFVYWVGTLDVIFTCLFINFYVKAYKSRQVRRAGENKKLEQKSE